MANLSKMQAQAIISKLGREYNKQRNKLIEEEKKSYTPSPKAEKLLTLMAKRDKLKAEAEEAAELAKKYADELNIVGYYTYSRTDEILNKLKTIEIEKKYPNIDLDAALDDLIIEYVEENFNVNNFIEQYLKQMRNG